MRGSWDPRDFPDLTESEYTVKSRRTARFNCIAWAADDSSRYWWPDPQYQVFWPSSAPHEETLIAFQMAYASIGYVPCDDGTLEDGFEKIAIFMDADGPTHAAWQKPDGSWSSKMGPLEDIVHQRLDRMAGPRGRAYGKPETYMRRPRRQRQSLES
jgi:hypothetical protein